MKKIIATSVMASSLLFPTFANAENLVFPAKMTTEMKVDIRRGATTSYSIIKSLNTGQQVTVIDEFTNTTGETWYRVDLGSVKGWGLAEDFTATPTSEQKIVLNRTDIRKGATASYPSIGAVSPNQKVEILDTFTNSTNEKWYRIKSGNLVGWIISTAFEAVDSSVNPQPINQTLYVGTNGALYSGATYKYTMVENIPLNSAVTVVDKFTNSLNQEWLRIKSPSGRLGWMPKSALNETKLSLSYVYSLNNAVIRRGASTNYSITVTLKANEKLTVIQELNGWLNVRTAAGKSGWMLKSQTSSTSLKGLISPTTYADGEDNYLVWQKPTNFDFTYSVAAPNQLKLTSGISDVELPNFDVKGIQSVEAVPSGSNQSVILTFEPGYTFTIRNYADKVSIKVMPTGILGKKIVIDAGHGGKDTGAIGPNGLLEKNANLGTALILKEELENAGATVTLTRSTDIFLELSERTDIANRSDADAFVSIHSDSFSTTSVGTTTYYNSTVNFNGPRSRALGNLIQENMMDTLDTYDRGVKEQEFYVNRMNELPSILVEMAFISNPKEEALLRSDDFRRKLAVGITEGFKEYFNNL